MINCVAIWQKVSLFCTNSKQDSCNIPTKNRTYQIDIYGEIVYNINIV